MTEDLAPTCDACHRSPPAVAFPVVDDADRDEQLCRECRRDRRVLEGGYDP